MRVDEAFVFGAVAGAVAVWLWGRKLEEGLEQTTRDVRTKAADAIQVVEDKIRPSPLAFEA